MIRIDAGMPTTRFCSLIGVPERTWRRHQARARSGRRPKGPWPRPARDKIRDAARRHALAHPAWGHRKVWAMCRHDGLPVSKGMVAWALGVNRRTLQRWVSERLVEPDLVTPGSYMRSDLQRLWQELRPLRSTDEDPPL